MLTNNNLASQTLVDCSQAGLKKMPTTKSEFAMAKISTPPGCQIVPGQGIFEYVYLLTSFVLYLVTALVCLINIC